MLAPIIKVAGSLVLLFKEVVESQVSVGVSNGAVVNAEHIRDIGRLRFCSCHCTGRYQSIFPIH